MANFSDYLEAQLLGVTLLGSSYTAAATVYVALLTALSDDGPTPTEVPTATGYGRQVVAFGAPSSGAVQSTPAVTFTEATTAWGTVTHIALYDADTGGNLLYWSLLDASRDIQTLDTFQIPDLGLTVTLD